jgi:hypothetical protein
MFTDPAATPLTTPEAFTVAFVASLVDHTPPAVGFVTVIVALEQTVTGPAIAPTTGLGSIVNTIEAVLVQDPAVTV